MSEHNLQTREEEMSFGDLLEQSFREEDTRDGEILQGTVVALNRDHVLVDFGSKAEGVVRLTEFEAVDGKPSVKVGDQFKVMIESRDSDEFGGLFILSKQRADRLRVWDEIARKRDKGEPIEGKITGRVKGGLEVDIGVKAFLPGSQVDVRPVRNLDKLIGETHKFKIEKFNRRRNNVVLSRKALIENERKDLKQKTLDRLNEGAILDGQIKNITEYGAFVDLGGLDGLLHITDMSWGRINHPSELFKVGDPVRVKVLKYDSANERVSLGIKQIKDDPWTDADKRYVLGTKVSGRIVSLTDYGAFVELEPGVEGLVHITEMSWTKRVKHPSKLYNIGDEVSAIVLDVDIGQKRISLGIKQTEPNPWTLLLKKYPVGTVISGPVRNITDFGLFVGVEDGIDGLVHVSDISWSGRIKHPSDVFEKNIEVEAVVLNIDVEHERFSLGIKQLTDDPWRAMPDRFEIGSKLPAKILKVTREFAYVELEPGIEALLPAHEYRSSGGDLVSNLRAGEELEVEIREIQSDDRKIIIRAS